MTPENAAVVQEPTLTGQAVAVSAPANEIAVEVTPAAPEIPELVARARTGDRQAFAALYRNYLPTVYKFLYYRLNANKAQAEDMTAEVFLRALRKIEDFNWTGADFGSWLLRIARNLVLDNAKSSRARLEILNDEMPEEAAGEARATEDSVMENLTNDGIYGAIKKLSPDQRDVITMRFIQGMDVTTVARALGKKEGTVRTLQFRGLKTLQKLLVKDGVVDPAAAAILPQGVRLAENGRSGGRTESEAARFGISDGDR
ncbi:MAG TPA: sigma-70 family RNA polymerase sigma factor [Actinomycetota bacterium]|nr:sigma-70 family RNA polymerase sigma factor [Actinomycetota bacterium]